MKMDNTTGTIFFCKSSYDKYKNLLQKPCFSVESNPFVPDITHVKFVWTQFYASIPKIIELQDNLKHQ